MTVHPVIQPTLAYECMQHKKKQMTNCYIAIMQAVSTSTLNSTMKLFIQCCLRNNKIQPTKANCLYIFNDHACMRHNLTACIRSQVYTQPGVDLISCLHDLSYLQQLWKMLQHHVKRINYHYQIWTIFTLMNDILNCHGLSLSLTSYSIDFMHF